MSSSQDLFDKEMSALLEHLVNVIKTHEEKKLKLENKTNPILKFLIKYKKTYEKSEPEDHKDYVMTLYDKHRTAILRGHQHDNWLKNNTVIIQFGDGSQKIFREIKIMLSSIYNTACTLRDETNERLDGLPDSAYQDCPELNYPDILLLHLYRIFREIVIDPKDRKRLAEIVQEIESLLGIESDSPIESLPNSISGALNAASGFLSQFGINLPKDKIPSEQDFGQVLNSIIQSPQTQQVFGTIFKDMENCEDPQQAIGKLFSSLQQSPVTKELLSNINQTANQTVNSDPVPAAEPIEAKVDLPDD